jgi:hypothetical protein
MDEARFPTNQIACDDDDVWQRIVRTFRVYKAQLWDEAISTHPFTT